MVAQASNCNRRRLERLLAGELSQNDERKATEHVETCDACRDAIETLAAGADWWKDAGTFLSSGEISCLVDDSSTSGNTIELSVVSDESAEVRDEPVLDFLSPSDNPAMLGRLGSYEILEVIGQGGMGIVFKGYDGELNRYLAIKVLAPCYASSAAARKRFAREAQAAAAIVHQHVVAIHGVDGSGKLPYLVMPFVACESLQERIDREGTLDTRDVLRIAMQAAEGLAAAHAQGLVHRDVKPANILLEKGVDRVLLTDFGLARAIDDAALTRSGVIAGTPQYMSPEQAKGASIDHRTDLFSLGSVMYAMCTARSPFRAETTMGVLRRICDGDVRSIREVNADTPFWLERIVMKLLSKSPSDRYETADEIASLLEQCLAHVQHPTAVSLPASLAACERNRLTPYAVGGALVAGLIAIAFFIAPPSDDATQRQNASSPSSLEGASHQVVERQLDVNPSPEQVGGRDSVDVAGPSFSNLDEYHWHDGLDQHMSALDYQIQTLEAIEF